MGLESVYETNRKHLIRICLTKFWHSSVLQVEICMQSRPMRLRLQAVLSTCTMQGSATVM